MIRKKTQHLTIQECENVSWTVRIDTASPGRSNLIKMGARNNTRILRLGPLLKKARREIRPEEVA